jgi:hypothetical protein
MEGSQVVQVAGDPRRRLDQFGGASEIELRLGRVEGPLRARADQIAKYTGRGFQARVDKPFVPVIGMDAG